ncbi:MAG: NUDIX hydrolase [Candidatus Jorgensenbacteria bacterium GW2011_GWA1_48_13]|uniref:Oxidized purine nucleoside triphosphate hydrolase n=1 Tax=Candidatus Jorgensenbacteria bacterium GW2011_GWB1_50_10 TaxID=1618665 RepID=A0A0G1W8W3_9BACT|nr:MAG: NUDIX hydrolase [Candidatus Jorgensenbacteria bacterium GW2011_GWA1_48_13]KKW15060.1 MAG: NUDIX hydrolase [Candidatus Jorgensenbacteria bacterium GW2011_GWB1_50_10]
MEISTICFPVRDSRVFLSNKKRGFGKGYLNGYGGKKKPGDTTVENTAVREMNEEGGVTTSPEGLEKVAVIDFFEGDTHLFECYIFFCRNWRGEFRETEEMAAPEPYDIGNPPYDRMWAADRDWLPLVFSGQKIRGRYYYNQGMTKQDRFEYEPLL